MNNCTANPTPAANQPSVYTHTYLISAYKYLVCERKRYERNTESYHSISAALYCLNRLINIYWPGSKAHKETYSHLEYDTDNYLHMWYSTMYNACNRRLNPHPDMISNIVFIRNLVSVNPADKKKDLITIEKDDKTTTCNCGCHHMDNNLYKEKEKLYWVEALLERLETARWCASIYAEYNENDTEMYQASVKILDIMNKICTQHNLRADTYHVHSIGQTNRFGPNPEINCIRALKDSSDEIENLKALLGKGRSYNWVGIDIQTDIYDLVKHLTQIYYK